MRNIAAGVSVLALLAASPARAQVTASTITAGSTPVYGICTNGYNIYNNNGIVGCQANGTGGITALTVGSTPTSGGAAGQIMYDSGSVLQESSGLTFVSSVLAAPALTTNAPGSVTSPVLYLNGDTTAGWYHPATSQMTYEVGGTNYLSLGGTFVRMGTAVDLCWATGDSTTGCGTKLTQGSAGVLQVGNSASLTGGTVSAAGYVFGGSAGVASKTFTLNTANMVTGCTFVVTAGGIVSNTGPC